MQITKTDLIGVLVLNIDVFEDSRGYFFESYNKLKYEKYFGIRTDFVQSMQSKSTKNTIRGLHYQVEPKAQAKLVHVLSGKILDVIVDIRNGSPSFGKHIAIELSESSKKQVWIPVGFAHGFSVLSDEAEVAYLVSGFYSKREERGIIYNDNDLNIDWKVNNPIVSEKDLRNKSISEIDLDFIYRD